MKNTKVTEKKIRTWVILFITGLVISGVTAFPLQAELDLVMDFSSWFPSRLVEFMDGVRTGVKATYTQYPFIAYGTDWLAFGHICIAIFFMGLLKDPVRNIWIVEAGMICCILVFPLALICGPLRGIPFFWRIIDCSFGLFGLVPLIIIHKLIRQLVRESKAQVQSSNV